jgi:hypothetical protein
MPILIIVNPGALLEAGIILLVVVFAAAVVPAVAALVVVVGAVSNPWKFGSLKHNGLELRRK